MNSIRLVRNLLFILFAAYFAQGSLYTTGSLVSQTCLFLILSISGVYFFKTLLIKNKKSSFYNIWTVLLCLNIIGFIILSDFSDPAKISMFKNILTCMLPFYPFYYFAKYSELKSCHLVLFFTMMLPVTILMFFTNKSNILYESNSSRPNVINNIAYMFVSLLPFVFLIKKRKIISGALMVLIMIFIIQGAKRGALISGAIGLIMYIYFQIRTLENSSRIQGFIAAVSVIAILSVFAYKTFMSNELIVQRMYSIAEGNSSNRTYIYSTIFDEWYSLKSIWSFIFGFGFASSLSLTGGTYAHNDWLELISNFGLLGVFTYLSLFLAAMNYIFIYNWQTNKRLLMLTIILIWFFITLVSMWYTSLGGFTQAILIAYLVGSNKEFLV
jgi:hypothetical protein